jgi:isoquinoline 1-oxidoreductase beta subunit
LLEEPRRVPPDSPTALDTERFKGVLQLAASKAGWGQPLPAGHGRGIAAIYGFQTYVAQVAEVSVARDGKIRVNRVVTAVDCGRVINPGIVVAQMESGTIYGLSAALKGQITVKNGRVEQGNFDTFEVIRIDEAPAMETHIVPSTAPPTGTGEPATAPIAGAVANAIFAATRKRVRRLPISPADLT